MTFDENLALDLYIGLVAILGTARLTRLGTEDSFPPAAWLRDKWISTFNSSKWADLAVCGFCQGTWWALATVATGWFTDFHIIWLLFYTWMSLAYVAPMIVARDIPADQR